MIIGRLESIYCSILEKYVAIVMKNDTSTLNSFERFSASWHPRKRGKLYLRRSRFLVMHHRPCSQVLRLLYELSNEVYTQVPTIKKRALLHIISNFLSSDLMIICCSVPGNCMAFPFVPGAVHHKLSALRIEVNVY